MINQYIENPSEALKIQKAIGIRIPPHLHTSAELIYVEDGSATLTLGSLEYTVQKGDFAYIMPSTLHSVIPDTYQTSVFVINAKTDLIEFSTKKYNGSRPASPVLRSHDVPRDLPYALTSLAVEDNDDVAISWLNLVFTLVCTNLRFATITEGATSDLSSRILAYLGAHYREPLSLEDLANAMGVSRFHLSHMFATKFGIGFKEYLNNLRIECAKGLLRSTDLPISEVYTLSGFENQRTFNRVFNESTGISPRDYRYGKSENIKKGKGKLKPSIPTPAPQTRNVDKTALRTEKENGAGRVSTVNIAATVPITPANIAAAAAIRTDTPKTADKANEPKKVKSSNEKTAKSSVKRAKDLDVSNETKTPISPFDKDNTKPTKPKRSGTAVWLL
ncbi:MAG: AraC family transcriptional regulator [Clostridia bacterium]|nr:AraC family transcriptional regulator [Clostridia bacterium]